MDAITTVLDAAAIILIVAGVGMLSIPAALIVAGVLVAAVSYSLARR